MKNCTRIAFFAFLAFAESVFAQESGAITVFYPEGSTVILSSEGASVDIGSVQSLSVNPGRYNLMIHHPNYRLFEESVEVHSQVNTVVLPRMELSSDYIDAQVHGLDSKIGRIQKTRNNLMTGAMVSGGIGLVGIAAAVGLEWALADRKQSLGEVYERYQIASAADATTIWNDIEAITKTIADLRISEYITLGATGVFACIGVVLSLAQPSTRDVVWRIELLRELNEK